MSNSFAVLSDDGLEDVYDRAEAFIREHPRKDFPIAPEFLLLLITEVQVRRGMETCQTKK